MTRAIDIINMSNWDGENFTVEEMKPDGTSTGKTTLFPCMETGLIDVPYTPGESVTIKITATENKKPEPFYNEDRMQVFPGHDGAELRRKGAMLRSAVFPVMKFFEWEHLKGKLRRISRTCCGLMVRMDEEGLAGPEFSAGLRKLLEAKDCFVRAALDRKV